MLLEEPSLRSILIIEEVRSIMRMRTKIKRVIHTNPIFEIRLLHPVVTALTRFLFPLISVLLLRLAVRDKLLGTVILWSPKREVI